MKRHLVLMLGICTLVVTGSALLSDPVAQAAPRNGKKPNLRKLAKLYEKAVAVNDVGTAIEAINRISELDTAKAAKLLVQITMARPEREDLYYPARDALGYFQSDEAIEALADLLTNVRRTKFEWRVMLAEVFDRLEHTRTTAALITALHDPEFPVRRQALTSLASRRDHSVVTALISQLAKLEQDHGMLWLQTRNLLTEMTGEDFATAADWQTFWEPRKESFDFEAGRGEKNEAETKEREQPKFFGSEVNSNRVLFIIDISGSMKMTDPEKPLEGADATDLKKNYDKLALEAPMPPRQRIQRAKQELVRVIKSLATSQWFNIMTFSDSTRMCNRQLVQATPKMKANAEKWISTLHEGGGTSTDRAFKDAFRQKNVNTIYLLSDGAPMHDPNKPVDQELMDSIVESVKNENRFRRIRINALGFDGPGIWHTRWGTRPITLVDPTKPEQAGAFASFMRRLATDNEGEYKSLQ